MPGAFVPPPYEELAPNGRRYFKILGVSRHLIRMYELLLDASDLAAVRPGGTGRAQAVEIDRLIARVRAEVEDNGRKTAVESIRLIQDAIEATRVRPQGQQRLLNAIESMVVPSILGAGAGAVGVGDIEALERGTLAPSARSKVPFYWRAQEFGSDHLVGHTLYGVFQPGSAPPEGPGPNRTHPFFEVRSSSPSYKMVVRNPIEERGFLRSGAFEAYEFRRGLHRVTEGKAVATMDRIASGTILPRRK